MGGRNFESHGAVEDIIRGLRTCISSKQRFFKARFTASRATRKIIIHKERASRIINLIFSDYQWMLMEGILTDCICSQEL